MLLIFFSNCEYTSDDKDNAQHITRTSMTEHSDCSGGEVFRYEGTWLDSKTHEAHTCVDSEAPVTNILHFTTSNSCAHGHKTPATHL